MATSQAPEWAIKISDDIDRLMGHGASQVRDRGGWAVELDVDTDTAVEAEINVADDTESEVWITVRTYARDHGCSHEAEIGFFPVNQAASAMLEARESYTE